MSLKVIPLGTVSPYCTESNNCPSYLIIYNNHKVLLDAGNGITKHLNLPNDLNNLTIIISHLHKDHFADLGSLQYASYVYHNLGILNEKPKIYLPSDYNNEKNSILNTQESYNQYYDIEEKTQIKLDDLKISFHNNNSHSIESYVTKLETKNKKIVYTSDIGNTNFEYLIEFCKDSNLLICESSFLRKHNINSSTHLTAYQAATLAKQANVKELMLTHFWPEENPMLYLEEAQQVFKRTILPIEGLINYESKKCKTKTLPYRREKHENINK